MQRPFPTNCSSLANLTLDCYKNIVLLINQANNEVWSQYKNSKENKLGADMYTVAILGLFSSIIVCLLFRSVRKSESADEQVVMLLSSMQIHVDFEERERQRKKMKEEKDKTQFFITGLAMKSFRRITRSRSANSHVPLRARSYQGLMPEIVVTDHQQSHGHNLLPFSQPMSPLSRHSSSGSYNSQYNYGSETGSVFLFPTDDGL